MRRPRWWIVGGAVALLAIGGLGAWWFRVEPQPQPQPLPAAAVFEPRYEIPKTLSYSFTLKNTSGRLLEDAEFWTYAPVKQTSAQHCCVRLDVSQPHDVDTDAWGNQAVHLRLAPLPPFASRVIRITAELRMAAEPNRLPQASAGPLLRAEQFVEADHPLIRAKAVELAGPDPLATAHQLFTWVSGHVRDTGYVRQDRGALYALKHQQGDCTENMYLFMALARANGIPSKAMGGYVIDGNGVLRPEAYHNWAEFEADGVWRIADPHGRVFSDRYGSYVAMRVVADTEGEPFQAHRFWHSGDGLDVKMN